MRLSDDQVRTYAQAGVLHLPGLLSRDEAAALRAEVERCQRLERDEVLRARDGQVHAIWALDGYSEPFRRLLPDPRLLGPAQQLLGPDLYAHQFKIVSKAAFQGIPFPWHHDYGSWQRNDGMPRPEALNIAIFLDEVTEHSGPLSYIPGSHRAGDAGGPLPTLSQEESGEPLPVVPQDRLTAVIEEAGILCPKGPPGDAVLFHACTVHGSPPNMSSRTRHVVYLTYNRTDNALTAPTRPWYMASREPRRIEPNPVTPPAQAPGAG
jgi:ectoine hydroxylase